jgi:hypothetical protein
MENFNEYKKICEFVDKHARALVGELCKRVEILEKQKVLTPELYKDLAREQVYEKARSLKDQLSLFFQMGSTVIVRKQPDRKEENHG